MRPARLKQRPGVSVVVPALDEECEIVYCLASLAHQTVRDFEIIIVDNASKDATASIARTWGVSTLSEPRLGISFARETGSHAATADIIASTDADTEMPTNWLERIHRIFVEDLEMVAIFGPYCYKLSSTIGKTPFFFAPG